MLFWLEQYCIIESQLAMTLLQWYYTVRVNIEPLNYKPRIEGLDRIECVDWLCSRRVSSWIYFNHRDHLVYPVLLRGISRPYLWVFGNAYWLLSPSDKKASTPVLQTVIA